MLKPPFVTADGKELETYGVVNTLSKNKRTFNRLLTT